MDACLINQQRNNVWDIKKTAGSSTVLYLGALVLLVYVVTSLMPWSGTNLCHQVNKKLMETKVPNEVKNIRTRNIHSGLRLVPSGNLFCGFK